MKVLVLAWFVFTSAKDAEHWLFTQHEPATMCWECSPTRFVCASVPVGALGEAKGVPWREFEDRCREPNS